MVVDALFPDILRTSLSMDIGNNLLPPIREYELVAAFGILNLLVWNVPPIRNPGASQPLVPILTRFPISVPISIHTIDQGRGILFIKDAGWN